MKFRPAFTLFELILAIALSATLLALIGTAINLYLMRVDAGRSRVEEAQLARSILATIAADLRATTTYQTQDISAIEELAQNAAEFDVDAIDRSGDFSSDLGNPSTAGGAGQAGAAGSASSTSSGESSAEGTENSSSLTPGLNGTIQELILDVARLPRLDELFPAVPQQQSASGNTATTLASAMNLPRPSDVKTIRYFVRQGNIVDPSDAAVTALSAAAQLRIGGLVRQTIDRAIRQMAEESGNNALLESGQVLVAPEVIQIAFRYFDGTTAYEVWDMQERGAMPSAIEVRIWLEANDGTAETTTAPVALGAIPSNSHMYIQTVDLPLAQSVGVSVATSETEEESSSETEDSEDAGGGGGGGGGGGTGGGQQP